MIAFDTDVLVEILLGNKQFVERATEARTSFRLVVE
jgi:predicted nucleic acid-binding protein